MAKRSTIVMFPDTPEGRARNKLQTALMVTLLSALIERRFGTAGVIAQLLQRVQPGTIELLRRAEWIGDGWWDVLMERAELLRGAPRHRRQRVYDAFANAEVGREWPFQRDLSQGLRVLARELDVEADASGRAA